MVSSESDTGHVERALTRFAVGLDLTDVPAAVAHQGRRALVNIVATSFAGCREAAVDTALRVLSPHSSGARVALLGRRETADMLLAAFVNAMAANIHDFDDTHPATIIHPSAPVVPALAALAQTRRTAGRGFPRRLPRRCGGRMPDRQRRLSQPLRQGLAHNPTSTDSLAMLGYGPSGLTQPTSDGSGFSRRPDAQACRGTASAAR